MMVVESVEVKVAQMVDQKVCMTARLIVALMVVWKAGKKVAQKA